MHTALLLLAEGRGENPDEGIGLLLIVGLILLVAATFAVVGTLVIRRSRRPDGRTGPQEEPHGPARGGRVSGVERDRARR